MRASFRGPKGEESHTKEAKMNRNPGQRQLLTIIIALILALTLGLLFLYIRQRLFTQADPIVLAT